MKKIYLATDHAGFELKNKVKDFLEKKGYKIEDFGAFEFNEKDDYNNFITPLAQKISADFSGRCPKSLGIIFGGSGQGEAMQANRNKHQNVRAALCWNNELVELARQHNNANILSIPARFVSLQQALGFVEIFINTNFEGGRHQTRVEKIPC